MTKERKIKMQKGYPTTDGNIHNKYYDAVKCQSEIDFTESCINSDVDIKDTKSFLKNNISVIEEYIKYHLTPKKPAEKKTGEKTAAKDKTANKKADG